MEELGRCPQEAEQAWKPIGLRMKETCQKQQNEWRTEGWVWRARREGARVLQALGDDICGLSHSLSQPYRNGGAERRRRGLRRRARLAGSGACRCCQRLFPSTLQAF